MSMPYNPNLTYKARILQVTDLARRESLCAMLLALVQCHNRNTITNDITSTNMSTITSIGISTMLE